MLKLLCGHRKTHKLAIPALRTAELTALTADCNELSNWVKSPVAPGIRLCSARTWRVSVMQFVSIGELDILKAQSNPMSSKKFRLETQTFGVTEDKTIP